MKIRALIVDDEQLARQRVRLLLGDEPDVEVIGESGDGFEAVDQIQATKPDLVFLDVQMPEMDGFEVLRRVPQALLPVVIFTTAYDQHALRAFEVNALDYLLKPFKPTRFKEAVQRARDLIANKHTGVAARGPARLAHSTCASVARYTISSSGSPSANDTRSATAAASRRARKYTASSARRRAATGRGSVLRQ